MNLKENILQGLDAVKANATRTAITGAIIAIGIAALVGILTSIDAMKFALTKTLSRMGTQSFNIRNSTNLRQRHGGGNSVVEYKPILYEQAKKFKKEFNYPSVISMSSVVSSASRVKYKEEETNPNIRVFGVDENYLQTAQYDIKRGRNFGLADIELGLPMAIIGADVRIRLFKEKNPVGQSISINGKKYMVVGELDSKGNSLGMSGGDRVIFLPVSRARIDFNDIEGNYLLNVAVNEVHQLDEAMDEAYITMRRVRGLRIQQESNFVLQKSDALARDLIDNLQMITTIGTAIGIITLLGAAISLMNIMLVSVTERTREIGVRKAMGAKRLTIRNQFLTEAVVISQLGGLGGIILGLIIGNIVGFAMGSGFIMPWGWIVMALVVCTATGLISGLYPAQKAAKLDPIESLRHE